MKPRFSIRVRNAQRKTPVDLPELEEFCARALQLVCNLPRKAGGALSALRDVTVILVSDRRIAALHQEFLSRPGSTDVLTFQEGDLYVSVETANRNSRQFHTSLREEIRLYIVHGLLHLHGFDDATPAKARAMNSVQRRLLREAGAR